MKENRRRKGNTLVVVMFAFLMAVISFSSLVLANALYSHNREEVKQYSSIQTYRSLAELAELQFVSDLETITTTVSYQGRWSPGTASHYLDSALTQVEDRLFEEDTDTESLIWKMDDIVTAISAMPISDSSCMPELLGDATKYRTEYKLSLNDNLSINYDKAYGNSDVGGVYNFPLKKIVSNVYLLVRGEELYDTLTVDNLYLQVNVSTVGKGNLATTTLTMSIVTGEGGVDIYRE